MQSINNNYYYTDKEIKAILDSIIIIIDTADFILILFFLTKSCRAIIFIIIFIIICVIIC
jgi:mannose/fructose/N-acetylgalactosamine-specific phosphotransferase system component IID